MTLLTVVDHLPTLDRDELDALLTPTRRQHDELRTAHASAARRALTA